MSSDREQSESHSLEDSAVQQGLRVRNIRLRRKMTLEQLSEQTGLSKGHLSRFERGAKSLSVAALMRVAHALNTSIGTMFGETVEEGSLHLSRRESRRILPAPDGHGDYEFSILSRPSVDIGATGLFITLRSSAVKTGDEYHSGDEIVYVAKGEIELELTDRSVILSQGDYAQFPGHLTHSLKGVAEVSEVLVVVVPS